MAIYDYRDDKNGYCTRITEYEYYRPTPGSDAKRNPKNFYILPLPENLPNEHFSADIQGFDLGEIGSSVDVMGRGFSDASTVEKIATMATGAAGITAMMRAIGLKAGGSITDAAAGAGAAAAIALPFASAYGGSTRNPHTAMIFNKMQMRSFQLAFRLSPRNKEQSRRLDTILKMLKENMHPTYNQTGKGFVLDYPMLYTVSFAGLPFQGYPEIAFSFLGDMSISNSPQGTAFFRGGYPAFVDLGLTFSEIDMKTRESFTGGRTPTDAARGSERF
ncbi:hypothetical protein UFOVP247_94 [uncultured Caudovirales phage]|uniref:Baseplate tail-tube protein gp48, T4-like virus n=1 Tax=uncultured Caudovirales phage TaxID=2100421 RepID=A0A6J7WYK0_9CAUD|nr:hypothetical protein UFOVP247_94 [uncultured Caudovirales phage]